jgi:SSS family solute:Na+ symporter
VAYLSREVTFVLDAAFSLRGLTSGALLGGLFIAVFWRGGSARPLVSGMLASLVFMIGVQTLQRVDWSKPAWMRIVKSEIYWPWYTLIGTIVTLAVALTVRSVLTDRRTPSPDISPRS